MTYILVLILISFSALFSGLTLGLMSLDVFELRRKVKLGNKAAARIYPLRIRGNELLTALLLGNVAVNSILAIFLGSIASGVVAGIVSTTLIFLFGEIIPQAVISRHAMSFGAATAPLVHILLFIFYPITKPISFLLDKMLGHELPTVYSKQELALLISEHEDNPHTEIDADEERIIHGALRFSDKEARDIMTPRTIVYMLEKGAVTTQEILDEIRKEGFSRVPVYEETHDNVVGYIHVRDLIGIKKKKISEIMEEILTVPDKTKLDSLFNVFLKKQQHIACLVSEYGGISGIVTLEDILEEVIGREILDEGDDIADLQQHARDINPFKKS